MFKKRVLPLFILAAVTTAGARTSAIDAQLRRASDFSDSNPDSALVVTREIAAMPGLTLPQKAELARTEGNARFNLGETDKALPRYAEAVALCRQSGDSLLLADILSDMGVVYRVSQKPDSALLCYNEALDIMQRCDAPPRDQAMLLTTIAIFYANARRHGDAVSFARRAMAMAEASRDLEVIMYAGSQGGAVLFQDGDKDGGLAIARRAVAVAEREKSEFYMLKAYLAMFQMHYLSGRQDSALFYYEKGRPLVDKVAENSLEAIAFLESSSMVLTQMGRFRESLDAQRKLLSLDKAGTFPVENLWHNMARNYRGLGDMDSMADAYEKCIELSDSVRRSTIDAQLSEFNVKYQTLEKEIEIARLESEKNRNRLIAFAAVAVAVILIGALVFYIVVRRRRELTEKLRANLQGIEQERERLARDLHDGVCNDLYGVSLLMQSGAASSSETATEIDRIRAEVRHISHELMPPRFKDTDLDSLLEAYALTSDGFLTYTSQGACGVPHDVAYQVYRIVQEILGNIRSHTDATSAAMAADFDGSGACITIRYSAKALNNVCPTSDGIGLTTMQRRCELIHAALMSATDGPESTVTIKI